MADGSRDGRGGRESTPEADRTTGPPSCPRCGTAMYKRHCKYVCPGHGVVIDCSDPFR